MVRAVGAKRELRRCGSRYCWLNMRFGFFRKTSKVSWEVHKWNLWYFWSLSIIVPQESAFWASWFYRGRAMMGLSTPPGGLPFVEEVTMPLVDQGLCSEVDGWESFGWNIFYSYHTHIMCTNTSRTWFHLDENLGPNRACWTPRLS